MNSVSNKTLEFTLRNSHANISKNIIKKETPKYYWIPLFPEYKIYRFLSDDSVIQTNKKFQGNFKFKPILLVNGYQSSHLTWNFFAKNLWKIGFRNIFALEIKDFTINLDEVYDIFDSAINAILSFVPIFDAVVLIGHSVGGVMGRYYIKQRELNNKLNVHLFIALASPYYGLLHTIKHIDSVFKLIFKPEELELFSEDKGLLSVDNKTQDCESHFVTMINIQGSLKLLAGGDGLFRPQPVSEMINYITNANHMKINKSYRVLNIIKDFICKPIDIYKIQLVSIDFPDIEILEKFDIFFTIKVSSKEQRYPLFEDIEISSKKNQLEVPQIIFVDKLAQKSNSIVHLAIYRKKHFTNELLIDGDVPVQFINKNSYQKEFIIKNQFVVLNLNLITYPLEKKI